MNVNLCLIKLCGIFSFTETERKELLSNIEFEHQYANKESWDYIQHQYYPVFRKFISNGPSQKDSSHLTDFDILTAGDKELKRNYKCEFHSAPGTVHTVYFSFTNIEIFLYPQSPGIISLEIGLDDTGCQLDLLPSLINHLRIYDNKISDSKSGEEITMEDLIHNVILKILPKKEGNNIEDFRGGKLKVFQCFDLEHDAKMEHEAVKHALFELGTLTSIGSFKDPTNYAAHSKQYYEKTMAEAISVYNNWRALCLFDIFTMVGTGYFNNKYSRTTWMENYFRIYIYNLYYKYYLFSINAKVLNQDSGLKKQREEFNDLIRVYNTPYISYNFLPNLLHEKIRKGLEIENETNALRNKIDFTTKLISEKSGILTNAILMCVTLIAILPSNIKDIYDDGFNWPNLSALLIKIITVLIVAIIFGVFRNKKKLRN
jgi:hypothetical protein